MSKQLEPGQAVPAHPSRRSQEACFGGVQCEAYRASLSLLGLFVGSPPSDTGRQQDLRRYIVADLVLYDATYEPERIGIVTLNNPDRRNALSEAVLKELREVLESIAVAGRVNAVIVRGAGTVYSSGHDLREILYGEPTDVLRLFEVCDETMHVVNEIPQVVIAEVHGVATAAGCQLVATADLAVASTKASFATPGVRIGFFCSTPAVALSRNVPRKKAAAMLFTGDPITAEEAERVGLVNKVVAPELLAEETLALARRVARFSSATLSTGKRNFYRQLQLNDAAASALATQVMATSSQSPDAKEGIDAFLSKRDPTWSDRQLVTP